MKNNIEKKAVASHLIERKMRSASTGKTNGETPSSLHSPFHLLNNQPLLPTINFMQRKVVQMQWAKDMFTAHPECNVVKLNMAGSGNLAWNKAQNPDGLRLEALKKQKIKNVDNIYGKKVDEPNISNTYIKRKVGTAGRIYTTFSMAGPQFLGGISDRGDNSIEKNIENGVKLLTNVLNKYSRKKFIIGIKGHSRNAVAASQVAKGIKASQPQRIKEIYMLLCDPVPGPMHAGINVKIDLNETYSGKDVYPATPTLASLDSGVKTTLVYSLALSAQHLAGFTPQTVINAQKIILTTDNHTCGLNKQDPVSERKRTFSPGFSGLKINELPTGDGVYLFNGTVLRKLDNGTEVIEAIKNNSNRTFHESRELAILNALVNKFPGDVALKNRINILNTFKILRFFK